MRPARPGHRRRSATRDPARSGRRRGGRPLDRCRELVLGGRDHHHARAHELSELGVAERVIEEVRAQSHENADARAGVVDESREPAEEPPPHFLVGGEREELLELVDDEHELRVSRRIRFVTRRARARRARARPRDRHGVLRPPSRAPQRAPRTDRPRGTCRNQPALRAGGAPPRSAGMSPAFTTDDLPMPTARRPRRACAPGAPRPAP